MFRPRFIGALRYKSVLSPTTCNATTDISLINPQLLGPAVDAGDGQCHWDLSLLIPLVNSHQLDCTGRKARVGVDERQPELGFHMFL